YYVAPDRPVFSGKTIVLANQNTGSAASILTGLIQDNQLAEIVGTTTANNPTGPTGMTPFKLPRSGIMISLPTGYGERAQPSNGDILQPDYWVENTVADLRTGRDAAFDKALELLQIKQSSIGPPLDEDVHGAMEFLKSLKEQGQQPGWSKSDRGAGHLEAYSYFGPQSVTFKIRKNGDSSIYHYAVIRASNTCVLRYCRRVLGEAPARARKANRRLASPAAGRSAKTAAVHAKGRPFQSSATVAAEAAQVTLLDDLLSYQAPPDDKSAAQSGPR